MKIDYEYDNTDNAIVEGIGFNIPIPFAGFGDRQIMNLIHQKEYVYMVIKKIQQITVVIF